MQRKGRFSGMLGAIKGLLMGLLLLPLALLAGLMGSVPLATWQMRHAIADNADWLVKAAVALCASVPLTVALVAFFGYLAVGGYGRLQLAVAQAQAQRDQRHDELETVTRLAQAQAMKALADTWPQMALPAPTVDVQPAPVAIPPLLPAIADEEAVILAGAKGSGKTTVAHHLLQARLDRGHRVLVLDPHAAPDKWLRGASGVTVIGGGRQFAACEEKLAAAAALLDRRYREIDEGRAAEGSHLPLTIIVDEYRAVVRGTSDAAEHIKTLLTEGRKVNIYFILGAHSTLVKGLGFEGESDLRDGIVTVALRRNKDGSREAEVAWNGGKGVPHALPGPFRAVPPPVPERSATRSERDSDFLEQNPSGNVPERSAGTPLTLEERLAAMPDNETRLKFLRSHGIAGNANQACEFVSMRRADVYAWWKEQDEREAQQEQAARVVVGEPTAYTNGNGRR